MMPNLTPTAEQQRELAAADAHELLRDRFMPVLLARPDAEAILDRVHCGDELRIHFRPADGAFVFLLGPEREKLDGDSLDTGDPATIDLANALGLALTASLNAEAPDKRRELARAMKGAVLIAGLRLNAHSETLVLHAADAAGRTVYCRQRVAEVDRRMAMH